MQDEVSKILAQRAAVAGPNRSFILVSLALHAAVAALFLVNPRNSQTVETPRVVNIRLSPAGTRGASLPRTSKRSARPAPRRPVPVEEAPKPPEVATKAVAKKIDPARTAEKSVFGKAPEPATKTGANSARPAGTSPVTSTAPAAEGGTGEDRFAMPGVGAAGVTGLEGGNFPYTVYIDRMTTRIGSNWFRPQVPGELVTRVYFVIERDGKLRDVRIEQSSGNRTFDRAAYRAVLESSPLPPLPMQYSGSFLGVHLTFH